MKYLVGIDDTDTTESRGTGFHARQLALKLEDASIGTVHGITRHQNYVHPAIRYTSQNSSACLLIETDNLENLNRFCRNFLLEIAPEGSDVGLCIANNDDIPKLVTRWGNRAKYELLTQEEALEIAGKFNSIYLEGLTGDHAGIIGALAAVGLRKYGSDGRFIWLKQKKELRDLKPGYYTPSQLREEFGIEQILIRLEKHFLGNGKIYIHEWFRPVLKHQKVTLIVEKFFNEDGKTSWKVASKEYIRSHS